MTHEDAVLWNSVNKCFIHRRGARRDSAHEGRSGAPYANILDAIDSTEQRTYWNVSLHRQQLYRRGKRDFVCIHVVRD